MLINTDQAIRKEEPLSNFFSVFIARMENSTEIFEKKKTRGTVLLSKPRTGLQRRLCLYASMYYNTILNGQEMELS